MSRLSRLELLLQAEPHDAFLLYAAAQEHAKAGGFLEAIAYYDRCLSVDPTHCYAYYHKAVSQRALRDQAGAQATIALGLAAAAKVGDAKARAELASLADAPGCA